MAIPKTVFYTEIVDEYAHAMSEAFDLPNDLADLQSDLHTVEDGGMFMTRPITEYESKAYDVEDPRAAVAMLSIGIRTPGKIHRFILDNSKGQLDEMLLRHRSLRDKELIEDLEMLETQEGFEDGNSLGVRAANYIGACQSRDGYEFDEACERFKYAMQHRSPLRPGMRYFIYVCLYQANVNLSRIADEIDRTESDPFDDFDWDLIGEIPLEPILVCLLYTSPSPRDQRGSRMPSSA